MAKDKFDILNDEGSKKVVEKAVLKENPTKPKKKETMGASLKGFPKDLYDAIVDEENKIITGNFNAYARKAIQKMAMDDGIYDPKAN